MPLLRTPMRSNTQILPASSGCKPLRSPWLALVLPITLAAGCSNGYNSRDIIDYTVSESEYYAALEALSPEPQMVAALPEQVIPMRKQAQQPITLASKPAPQPIAPTIAPTDVAKPVYAPQDPIMAAAEVAAISDPGLLAAVTPTTPIEEPELASAFDKKAYIDSLGFGKSVYATVGIGASRLNPDTSAVPGWSPDETIAGAGQVAIGVDLGKRLSVELHSADYGSAGLSPEGRVNYHMNGVSALLYAGKNLDRFRRRGLNGYARIGFNQLENTPIGNIPFIEQTSQHASFGLGAEYTTRIGLGLRADVVAYDGDVQAGQLGMLYRMGKKPKRAKLAMADTAAQTTTPQLAAAMPAPANSPQDIKLEPVLSAAQATTPTQMQHQNSEVTVVDFVEQQTLYVEPPADPCSSLNGTLNNVSFYNGSSDLTRSAATALNDVAATLKNCTDRKIEISAHTDSAGSAAANNTLSKNRAKQVAIHLAHQGINMNRIRAVAYGESRPIASNSTLDGRMRNRRVELSVH